ncbi:MAG: choice-of-anchor D domain-containing protein [Verrucomicrobiaceae bacterium]|nr:MAG: choice-of-anchor D domain-containing protein [Verrucomicrobiaceae bacterium]
MRRHIFYLILLALQILGPPLPAGTLSGKTLPIPSVDQVSKSLAKSDWQSIRAAYEAGRHKFQPVENGWQARNPGQQWTTRFDGRGFLAEPPDGNWRWGLELKAYGFSGTEAEIRGGAAAVQADGQRLTYRWDDLVDEWWVNDARGLEHGFIIRRRPGGDSQSELSFLLGTRGSLAPKVAADAQGILFQDASENTVINYAGLKVWDADGKALPARFEAAGGDQVRLVVLEGGARYPLTIDPIAQQAYLKASNPGEDDYFGAAVAVSGDIVVVGAPGEKSSTRGINSAPNDDSISVGAAYIFLRSGGVWGQQAYLKASNARGGDQFGSAVAVSGDTVVIGAYGEASITTGINSVPDYSTFGEAGAAYVFVRSGEGWSQQAYLKASNTEAYDRFGHSVAVNDDTVVIGAYCEDSSTMGIDGASNENAADSGAAYVFARSGAVWSQQAYLKAGNTGFQDHFGSSVSVSGDTVVVGAPGEDSSSIGINTTPNESDLGAGAAYVFARSGGVWSQRAYLKSNHTPGSGAFGTSVAVSGDTVLVGAPGDFINGEGPLPLASGGAAHVFVQSLGVWRHQAYLKAAGNLLSIRFGSSVAVSGDRVVVGDPQESSSTTGVDSIPDTNIGSAGAAYVYVRNGVGWSQEAYLKAGNTGDHDFFGTSVAVSGETVVAGSPWESSSTAGVNSTSNESASKAGAAYVYAGFAGAAAPEISLVGNGRNITNGDAAPGAADYRDFGSVAVNGSTVTRMFTIHNSGPAALNLTGTPRVSLSDGSVFTVNMQPASATVEPNGGSQIFEITFDPYAAGVQTATVSIASNDADENPFSFVVQGMGTAAGKYTRIIALGGELAFGNVQAGQSAQRTLSLGNTGDQVLTVSGISWPPGFSGDWNGGTVPAGGHRSIAVTFAPLLAGAYGGQIAISSDRTSGVSNIACSGTGLAPSPVQPGSKPTAVTQVLPFKRPGDPREFAPGVITALTDEGRILARGGGSGADQMLVAGKPGELKVIASLNQLMPGAGGLALKDSLANILSLAQDGRVAFVSKLGAEGRDDRWGIFQWDEMNGLVTVFLDPPAVTGIPVASVRRQGTGLSLAGNGTLSFYASRNDTAAGSSLGVYSYPPLAPLEGTFLPPPLSNYFGSEGFLCSNARGDVFYSAHNGANPGLKRWNSGQVMGIADFRSGNDGFSSLSADRCNAFGDLAYSGTWENAAGTLTRMEFWHWRGGQNQPVMREGNPVPGLSGATYGTGSILAVTDDGAVIFRSNLGGRQSGRAYLHWKDGHTAVIAREGMVADGAPGINFFPTAIYISDNGKAVIAAQNGSGGNGDSGLWYWEPGLTEARVIAVGNPPEINVPGRGYVPIGGLPGEPNIGSNSGSCSLLNRHGLLAMGNKPDTDYGLILDVRTLALGTPPEIVSPPHDAVVAAGANHTFSVASGGTVPQVFQWFKNGQEIPGATSNILTVSNVSLNGNGSSYSVLIENALGATMSPVALLTVLNEGMVTDTRIIRLSGNLDFGNVRPGESAQSLLVLENTGNRDLTVSGIHWPAAFLGDWNGGTVPAGGSRDINVTFTPTAAGAFGASGALGACESPH